MGEIVDLTGVKTDEIGAISIGIMSPDRVKELSHGQVTSHETISYKDGKPVTGGLFCQKIFGPLKDYTCACGKCNSSTYAGRICSFCGVEVTTSDVRRSRMGHIELAAPVAHIWYTRTVPCRMAILLDMKQADLKDVLGYAKYVVTDPGVDTDLEKCQTLTESEYTLACEKWDDDFTAAKGAEPLKQLLSELNLPELEKELIENIDKTTSLDKKKKYRKRLDLVRQFRKSGNKPEWMILDVLPVMPPDLRPMSQLSSGSFAVSDINELYRRVIIRNNRLKEMILAGAPSVILDNEKRMLQEAVDNLLDNSRVPQNKKALGKDKRELKGIASSIGKKQGRFRRNLLGKRVDYSGRSVIVVGPELKIYECGLPKELALELYKPFVCKYLTDIIPKLTVKAAKHMIERNEPIVYDALEHVIDGHPVFLNRAPTLHRLGIQAFQPVLVEGSAIKLHPLVCTAFNADFDGDQMGVHLPVSPEAQAEARFLMFSTNNLLKPSDGTPVVTPSQDMVLGAYYLTSVEADAKGAGHCYRDEDEAIMAYQSNAIHLHAPIKVRRTVNNITKLVETTVGRVIFNQGIPQDLGYVDRTDPEHACDYEISFLVKKGELSKIIERCIFKYDNATAANLLDYIKSMGYKYATKSGITVSAFDAVIPEEKAQIVKDAEAKVEKLNKQYKRGFITAAERSRLFIDTWNKATDAVTEKVKEHYDVVHNPIHIMADSGARGSIAQLRQMVGMRGLIANTAGKTIEMPIKSNYREGLSGLEYFIAARGARKGFVDTAMRTADSGYLTRRLVTIAQDVVVREYDCGCHEGIEVKAINTDSGDMIESFEERIIGRYLVDPLVINGETIWGTDKAINRDAAAKIVKLTDKLTVRSVMTCHTENGVCCHCYGTHLATNRDVEIGDAIGIISAQSIGEPGTQLTMRTFHTGGIASGEDITQGLPRVEEIFENRKPKVCGILADVDGTVSVTEKAIIITPDDESIKPVKYSKSYDTKLFVQDGDTVKRGDKLTAGTLQPADVLRVQGVSAVREYITSEIQKVYRLQGVDINDKHIEIIIRQMMNKVRILDAGDTKLAVGALYTKSIVDKLNSNSESPATYEYAILGLTKMNTNSDSFLSAAAFQESTKALTDAAIAGKIDNLKGLNENVLMGKLIPAGTGLPVYNNVQIVKAEDAVKDFVTLEELEELGTSTNN